MTSHHKSYMYATSFRALMRHSKQTHAWLFLVPIACNFKVPSDHHAHYSKTLYSNNLSLDELCSQIGQADKGCFVLFSPDQWLQVSQSVDIGGTLVTVSSNQVEIPGLGHFTMC